MRTSTVHRRTEETQVAVTLTLEGTGVHEVHTGLGFLDHMLTQLAVHGLFDLSLTAEGDLHIDPHHTVEDVALTLGIAFDKALGDRSGIVRMGAMHAPLDETLAFVAVDLSGRPYSSVDIAWSGTSIGDVPVTLIEHFFSSFAVAARTTLHAQILCGRDDHHRAEALFKALARALDQAVRTDPRREGTVPSSKGKL
jgi:imidazoleglycerol-phosphate dehydratase